MRQTTRRATRRARVQESQDTGQFRVVAPQSVRRDAGGSALALADSLNSFFRAAPRLDQALETQASQQAAEDVQTGSVDQDLLDRSDRYRRSVARTQARAGWVEDEAEFDETIRSLQLDDLDPEEQVSTLNRALDELYAEKYAGLDDEDVAEFLLPQMEQYRAEKNAELMERQQAQLVEQQTAALQTIAQDMHGAALEAAREANPNAAPEDLTASGAFDYQGLHEEIVAQFPRAETNEVYFSILKDIAIRTGDPDLIRNIPDRWDHGDRMASFKASPAWNERVLQAEQRAEATKAAQLRAASEAAKAERKSIYEASEAEGYLRAISGEDPTAWAREQVAAGRLEGRAANSIVGAFRAAQAYRGSTAPDAELLGEVNIAIRTAPESVSFDDLQALMLRGAFGDPNTSQGQANYRQALNDLVSAREKSQRLATSNPQAKVVLDRFKTEHEPRRNPITGDFLSPEGERFLYAELRAELQNRLIAGEPPEEAGRAVSEQYRERLRGIQQADQARAGGRGVTLQQMVQSSGGTLRPDNVVTSMRANGWSSRRMAQEIAAARASGLIGPSLARQVISEIRATTGD